MSASHPKAGIRQVCFVPVVGLRRQLFRDILLVLLHIPDDVAFGILDHQLVRLGNQAAAGVIKIAAVGEIQVLLDRY